ncbi:HEPN domain-containing protein [Aestuariivivens insulae]|uniref:HEPN domain-containing protein n=1 Tax=Aestuariivivens insulae TaxID=1621988 RepID=UPI001F5A3862|nr:HEPN domain-containing protein [Aestuariivivens insulae]
MKNEANALFDRAFQSLNKANKELYRPEEDIVPYSVCKNSQFAIMNFLKGYLYKNGIDTTPFITINQLLKECKKVNKDFEKLDFSDLNCTHHEIDSKYCTEVSKVNTCFATANNLYAFLKEVKLITN